MLLAVFYHFMQPHTQKETSQYHQQRIFTTQSSRHKPIIKQHQLASPMAEDYNTGSNWWDSSRPRFDAASSSSFSSGLTSLGVGSSFGWPSEKVDVRSKSSLDSSSVSHSFHDIKLQQSGHGHDSRTAGEHLHMMGLGLSSQPVDWNQALLRGEKSEGSFRSMLQENLNTSSSYQQESRIGSSQVQWREKMFTGLSGDSSMNEYKQTSRGFSLDQPQFSPHGSSSDSNVQGIQSTFQIDSSAIYGSPSPTMMYELLGSDQHQQQQQQQYGGSYGNEMAASWSNKVPQFMRNSPSKQTPHNPLQFSNNAPFWNASASNMSEVRPGFFPSLHPQFPSTNFEEKPKNTSEVGESRTAVKRSGSEASTKRPRNETPSPLPAFKVRKEKMGDRITALQQLVSPFGKTDTASVLSEAIEYIKFLHEQVTVLSTPYMKSGAPIHHQQGCDKSKDPEGQKQDLRSRGLCLVPVSSTFPVTQETTVDFWTPTFGGTFR